MMPPRRTASASRCFENIEAASRGRLGSLEDRMMAVEKRLNMPADTQ
jgi:hypothetical protein